MEQLANSIQSISFEQLAQKIITVDDSMRGVAVKTINQATTLRNWIYGHENETYNSVIGV